MAIPGIPGPSLLGPGGLARRSRNSRAPALAELLRRRCIPPIDGGPPAWPYGPGDMLRCLDERGPGESGRGGLLYIPGDTERFMARLFLSFGARTARGLPAGDIDRFEAGLFRPRGGGGPFRMGGFMDWFVGCGRGFDGLAARHVLGTTPCFDRSRRVARH